MRDEDSDYRSIRTRPHRRGAHDIPVARVLILGVLVYALWNTAVLAALLAPALRMAGERSSSARYFLRCGLLGLMWGVTFWVGVVFISELIGGISQTRNVALLAVPIFTAGGFSMGLALRRLTPLPKIVAPMALAGASVGAVATIAASFYGTPNDVYAAVGGLLYYSLAPAAATYPSALARYRRLRAYDRGDCLACGFEGGARRTTDDGRCPECQQKRRVCHRCRRVVERATGEACPRCRATLDAACWRCGYDWTGVTDPACPECGGWKPAGALPQRAGG